MVMRVRPQNERSPGDRDRCRSAAFANVDNLYNARPTENLSVTATDCENAYERSLEFNGTGDMD